MNNYLFICSRNKWRSPTGERVWRNKFKLNTRSAGTSSKANRVVSKNDIQWATVILVMEDRHKTILNKKFRECLVNKKIIVLGIPDVYQYMDAELVETFEAIGEEFKNEN